jgi:hypothetical protein
MVCKLRVYIYMCQKRLFDTLAVLRKSYKIEIENCYINGLGCGKHWV